MKNFYMIWKKNDFFLEALDDAHLNKERKK